MKRKLSLGTLLLPLLLLILSSSCKKEATDAITGDTMATRASIAASPATEGRMLESQLLKSVRQATSRFNSTNQAVQAGYLPDDHCVSHPTLGAMGYHWVKPSLVDPVFDPLQPEVMLYATGPGGNLRLVAVEYLVINVGQPRPMFDSQAFTIGGAPLPVAHWSLHVWLHENNPSGMFMPFNPNVTCP